jgi:V-type H+-transporting ATPase subunit C
MDKKIREILNNQYGKLDGSAYGRDENDNIEEYQNLIDKDYYPYVYFHLEFDVYKR